LIPSTPAPAGTDLDDKVQPAIAQFPLFATGDFLYFNRSYPDSVEIIIRFRRHTNHLFQDQKTEKGITRWDFCKVSVH
jgi:hypothetical protein